MDNPYPTGQGGANVPGFNAISLGRAQLAAVALTSRFGPTSINELRFGYMRTANNVGQPVGGVGPTLASQGFIDAAGNPGIVPLAPAIEGIENVAFNDFTIGVDTTGLRQANNTYQWSDNFSKVAGKHILKDDLRWDLLPPWREKYNQLQTLVPGQQSVVYPGAPAGLVFPGDPGIPGTLAPAKHTNFAPRIGLAYSPDARTSVRAGHGLFYTAFEGLSAGIMSANPPYGYDYNSFAPPLFATPFVTAASGENVGQRFPSPIPAFGASARNPNTSVDWAQYVPITGVPPFFHENVTPYSGDVLKDHRQFQLQRAGGFAPPVHAITGIAGWLHVRQIAGSIVQPGRGGQSRQSEPEQGDLGF